MYECILKSKDIMVDNTVNQKQAELFLDKSITDPVWLPILKKVTTDCLTKTAPIIKEVEKFFSLTLTKPVDCNFKVLAFIECFKSEEFAACPPTSWKNSKECNAIKESVVKCNANAENVIMSYIGKIPKASSINT